MMRKLWCLVAVLMISSITYTQSFGCSSKAKLSVTEQTICHNSQLSALDNRLSKLYQQAVKVSSAPDVLKQDQLVWLRNNRNLCANDKKCLTKVYQSRLQLLTTVIANPQAPIPQYYPVRWDHSIDLPPAKPSSDYPKFVNLDHSSNITNRGLNSKNPCVQMFLQQSVPAKKSNVADYQFTSNTLDELPPNIGDVPNRSAGQLVSGFLAGQSRKVMDPSAKIIYLRSHELIFRHPVASANKDNPGAEAVKVKIIAWGHFKDKYPDQLEDMLLYASENWLVATFLYANKNRQWTKKIWEGWKNDGDFTVYIIATKKDHETKLRTRGFYRIIGDKCSLMNRDLVKTNTAFNEYDGASLLFVPTFDLQFPH